MSKRKIKLMATCSFGFLTAVLLGTRLAHAQNLQRFAANTLFTGGDETEATVSDTMGSPVHFYSNDVKTPAAINIMYVHLSATGDGHAGNATIVQCKIDGTACSTGGGSEGTPGNGWVVLQRHETGDPGDLHDNNVNYTWCATVSKGTKHHVDLNLANSADADDSVFLEAINVFVDGEHIKDASQACTSKGSLDQSNP